MAREVQRACVLDRDARGPSGHVVANDPGALAAPAGPSAGLRAEGVADIARKATSGLAPEPRQSGKTGFLRCPADGDKALKSVFHQVASRSSGRPDSRAFHDRAPPRAAPST